MKRRIVDVNRFFSSTPIHLPLVQVVKVDTRSQKETVHSCPSIMPKSLNLLNSEYHSPEVYDMEINVVPSATKIVDN